MDSCEHCGLYDICWDLGLRVGVGCQVNEIADMEGICASDGVDVDGMGEWGESVGIF